MLPENNVNNSIQYHKWLNDGPKLDVKVEKNSRGYNWEIKVTGADQDEAINLITQVDERLRILYGDPQA